MHIGLLIYMILVSIMLSLQCHTVWNTHWAASHLPFHGGHDRLSTKVKIKQLNKRVNKFTWHVFHSLNCAINYFSQFLQFPTCAILSPIYTVYIVYIIFYHTHTWEKAFCPGCGGPPGPPQWAPWRRPVLDHKRAAGCTEPPVYSSSPPPVQLPDRHIAETRWAAHHCSAAPGAAPYGQSSPVHTFIWSERHSG